MMHDMKPLVRASGSAQHIPTGYAWNALIDRVEALESDLDLARNDILGLRGKIERTVPEIIASVRRRYSLSELMEKNSDRLGVTEDLSQFERVRDFLVWLGREDS